MGQRHSDDLAMGMETLEDVLFPGLNIVVRQETVEDDSIMVDAACCGPPGSCPLCQHPAARVHSRYGRYVAGLPAGGRQVMVRLRVRRFFCDQSQCRRRTYVEQVAGLTEPTRAPRVLGIDEFAFRKGRTYGTVLVDVESSRPVDVLPDRETGTVAAWLREHPGAEIICGDRLMAFTRAIRQAAPDALEVADRRHLLQNLSTAVEKTCRRHRDCLRRPAGPEVSPPLATPNTPLLDRIRRRHAEVNEHAATGMSLNAIGRRLHLDRKKARRYRNKDHPTGPPRRYRRPHPALQLRPRRRSRQQDRNDQAPDIRQSLIRPARSPHPPAGVAITEERSEPTGTLRGHVQHPVTTMRLSA
ncbi:transposase [Streptomyces virginiae]|uniref:transposase n=1 Tax=Streptomyces virginiae TaxID=1961 RepID=UPI003679BB60